MEPLSATHTPIKAANSGLKLVFDFWLFTERFRVCSKAALSNSDNAREFELSIDSGTESG